MSENDQLYISYEVISKDADGNVLRTDTIEATHSLTISDIGKAATRKGLDKLEIQPTGVVDDD